jgi:biopolymer transport protein ExbD
MAVRIKKGDALSGLNLTPLIDVIFQLLIFFFVAARFEREDRELDVPLPDASEARPLTAAPQELWININKDGVYFVDGRRMQLPELEQLLKRRAVDNPLNQSVIVRADKRVALDSVVQAVNLCKKAGIRDYVVNTEGD